MADYYPWRSRSASVYAWDRTAAHEFLRHEQQQLDRAHQWFKVVRSAHAREPHDSVNLYTVEVGELRADWRAAVAMAGEYQVVGLSALMNGLHAPLLALVPAHARKPDPFRLIRIHNAKTIFLHRGKSRFVDPVVVFEEWEYRPSDEVYLDVPYERRLVRDILSETVTGGDKRVANEIEAPLLSAPGTATHPGGIGVAGTSRRTAFATTFHTMQQKLLPIEYRALQPPDSAVKGHVDVWDDIRFRVAERLQPTRHQVQPLSHVDLAQLRAALRTRGGAIAEHSLVTAWIPPEASAKNIENAWTYRQLLEGVAACDITMSSDITEVLAGDVDLTRLQPFLDDDDVMLTIANARQLMPAPPQFEEAAFRSRLLHDLDVVVGDGFSPDVRDAELRRLVPGIADGIVACSQAAARSDGMGRATEEHFRTARAESLDRLTELRKRSDVKKIVKSAIQKRDPAVESIANVLRHQGPMPFLELWTNLQASGRFRDPTALQTTLDRLRGDNLVILDRRLKYVWIGA